MVLYTFLALLSISMIILAFQVTGREDCSQISIELASRNNAGKHTSFSTGEVITFKAATTAGSDSGLTWDFGDSTATTSGLQVYHAFTKAGTYMVTLSHGKCTWNQEVIIINALADNTPAPAADLYPTIDGPEEILAGRAVTFTNSTANANTWQWQLLQRGAEVHSGRSVTYTFSSPGERILSLIINGDSSKMVTKHIMVFPAQSNHKVPDFTPMPFPDENKTPEPAPVPAAPEKPKVPSVSDDEFKFMLSQVVDKQKNASDFSAYLCENINARVLLNDKDTDTFSHFCSRIRGKRRFKIEVVNLIKDQNGCVKEIRVRYDKKFLGIF
ncbi:PKD domain-containing protein [Chitinophaga sancti]|nr:PKD domain-containing protein [Chitinophaga sancti]WQD61907.1 PKD domain-containing protein [Chitinophaga sancti]WQG92524.1 PKD domain-containing protein [Chitinophaga sancti]